ncbi:hypothetical protein LOCC1_G000327 [Lachnellula occidentalis]|uniref:Uncharacterized protein n=1 Tax=Lachnellula occidentalis TaxID=215460 RepID=A0A8H8UKN0_9HELO|nr:hypothetical protein LOCC1_G000327 [Lachnellula occidentalis]
MDESNRGRRQNDSPYTASDPRFNTGQAQGQAQQSRAFATSSAERYRAATLTASPTAGRGAAAGAATYPAGFYQEPQAAFSAALPANPLQYQSAYPQDQRQQQSFSNYNQDLMYNVAQQAPQSNVYDSSQQFQSRQPAAMQLLSDVAAPYFSNEPTNVSGPPGMPLHASSGSSAVYQQHQQSPENRAPMLQQGYTGAMAMGGISQATEAMDEDEFQVQGPGMEAAYTAYQTALKEIFQNIIQGRLAVAAQSLLEISEWLLGHVGDLDRIRLWGEFNTAWLAIFQKQKDLLEAGPRARHSPNLMSQEVINKMAKDLIRMCDAVEKHGLVDYQYGVAEERIMMKCLDLQESIEGIQGSGPGRAPP